MEALKNKRVVFIFDECHRTQFGRTHKNIKNFFEQCQMFGFTGTPIFEQNAGTNEYGKRTTKMLFGDCLHKYVITDAIRDQNVLKFSVEYIRTFREKGHILDIEVEDIDEAEAMNAPQRLNNIIDYIIANHNRKTHSREFTAMFCVSSIPILIAYYNLFLQKKQEGLHNLKIATIFSYYANEADKDAGGYVEDDEFLSMAAEPPVEYSTQHSRDELEGFMQHYNEQFGTNFTSKDSQSFYNYYNDISKRVRHKQIDILLVVNMFLTGFDSKPLNTLYVDKNLKYHGLIQAYSRTNRILNEVKSQGNIVCFRNLKSATDEAITLFSNINAKDEIIMQPYEDYVAKFNQAYIALLQITPTVNSVNDLLSEEEELKFIRAFRELMRLKNVLTTFTDFTFDDLSMSEQDFEDYKSKYLDLYEKAKGDHLKEKVSILDDIDFELELIHRDEINVAYILKLLAKLKDAADLGEHDRQQKAIMDIILGDVQLRSKRELIEKFIQENLPQIGDADDIPDEFAVFWDKERKAALDKLSKNEDLDSDKLQEVISKHLFTGKKPLRDDVIAMLNKRPALKDRGTIAERITTKIIDFVETYISGIAA
jgi:type I restriction enzyme R subunit